MVVVETRQFEKQAALLMGPEEKHALIWFVGCILKVVMLSKARVARASSGGRAVVVVSAGAFE